MPVDQHNAVLGTLVAGACRADGHAGRVVAMQAGAREMQRPAVRALAQLEQLRMITAKEKKSARAVLRAAAMTYVAAAVQTLLVLLYYLFRAGLLGGRDE